MSLISVKAKNYKQHSDIDFTLDGKSIVLIGDSEAGKTNFMNLILSHLGITEFPKDAQKEGTDDGMTETKWDINGVEYVIKREFRNGVLKRFRMTADGRGVTWEDEIKKIFNGLSPATSYFDYAKFFFELRTAEKRFEYMIQCAVGAKFFENKKLIDDKTEERGSVGTQRKLFESRLATSDLNQDNYKSMLEYFAEKKPTDEAEKAKEEILNERKSVAEASKNLEEAKESNNKTRLAIEFKSNFEKEVEDIDAQIEALNKKKQDVMEKIVRCDDRINEFPLDEDREGELRVQLDSIEESNREIEARANEVYSDLMKDVEIFNTKREKFNTDRKDLDQFLRLNEEWEELDRSIKDLKQENIDLFRQRLPLPELEIHESYSKAGDPTSKIKYELLYKGRAVSFDVMSKGETLRFALDVQKALSPENLKIIFIPEGQSMGSGLDEMVQVAREHGIQTVVEITERKRNFEIQFEEQYLK